MSEIICREGPAYSGGCHSGDRERHYAVKPVVFMSIYWIEFCSEEYETCDAGETQLKTYIVKCPWGKDQDDYGSKKQRIP